MHAGVGPSAEAIAAEGARGPGFEEWAATAEGNPGSAVAAGDGSVEPDSHQQDGGWIYM